MRSPALPRMSEKEFQSQVVELAKANGWKLIHFRPGLNRRGRWSVALEGDPGWPDLFFVHEKRRKALAMELKAEGGDPTPDQRAWANALNAAGIPAYIFWPTDFNVIQRLLCE